MYSVEVKHSFYMLCVWSTGVRITLLSSLFTEKEPPVSTAWNLMKENPTITRGELFPIT
jgi:hypothetical protein